MEAAQEEVASAGPGFCPTEAFLYGAPAQWRRTPDLAEPGKPPRTLGPMSSSAQYSGPGYLVFVQEGALLGQKFDLEAGRLTGSPFALADRVNYFYSTGHAAFAASRSSTIVFQPHEDVSRLTWIESRAARSIRSGAETTELCVARTAPGFLRSDTARDRDLSTSGVRPRLGGRDPVTSTRNRDRPGLCRMQEHLYSAKPLSAELFVGAWRTAARRI